MFQRTKKTAGRLYDYTKKITNIDEAKKNAQDLRVIVQDHANPFKKHQARQETFQAAMQRLGIQMQDLGSTYKYYSNRFYLFTFFSLLTFCCAAWALFQTNWVMFGPSVSIFLVFSIHALSASFRASQIRHQELYPFMVFLKHPEEWLPPDYAPDTNLPVKVASNQSPSQKSKRGRR